MSEELGHNSMTPLDLQDVFGEAGVIYPPLVDTILAEATGTPYNFATLAEFEALRHERRDQVYWAEMLARAHWAATSHLVRHSHWFNGCQALSIESPNFPAFCACLRSLIEAAADGFHSLNAVPGTLATHCNQISECLAGTSEVSVGSMELENALIHFLFARKVNRSECAPGSHKAETATTYIGTIDSERHAVRQMYSELCQIVHPAAQSLHWLTRVDDPHWAVSIGSDIGAIRDICSRYRETIEWVQQQSVNISIFILQVLNVFPLPGVHTHAVRDIRMSRIPLCHRINDALTAQGVAWGV